MSSNNKNNSPTFISIVSGKGGTGKSLFTAVLGSCLAKGNCKVLLVDMDIYVRGLTILLSSYMDSDNSKNSISDYISEGNRNKEFSVYRFQECEFIPAVKEISEPLVFSADNNFFIEFPDKFFDDLKSFAENKFYDVVLLDCRSGLDSSIISCAKNSDFVFSVSEDDDVCLNANLNLVNYFRHDERINNIYTIINKGRRISNVQDIRDKIDRIFDFSCIGVIPFDEQIMDDYGKPRFWYSVYDTLYFYGLIMTWEKFQAKTKIKYNIDEKKYNIRNDKTKIIKKQAFSTKSIFRLYGLLLIILSAILPFIGEFVDFHYIKYFDHLPSILAIIGVLMLGASSSNFRRLMLGKDDNPTRFD
ncbi:MAG: AAA family ATPase [Oscillospiraceae bacterium]|nr:AAA family ATPase [Oscillospiraceae bacterium]